MEYYIKPNYPEKIQKSLSMMSQEAQTIIRDTFTTVLPEIEKAGELVFTSKSYDELLTSYKTIQINERRLLFAKLFFDLHILEFEKLAQAGDVIELTKDKGVIKKVLMSGDDGPKP